MKQKKSIRHKFLVVATVICTALSIIPAMAAPMQVSAAEEAGTVTVLTTQRCSIWSAPATVEENRTKYVDEGYQITVYPEVVASTLGDGKTFYRTVKGAYVLCRCVDGADGSEAGTESESSTAGIPTLPVIVHTVRYDESDGSWSVSEYDADWNRVRHTSYNVDGSIDAFVIFEYDASGNCIKRTIYNADGSINSTLINEFDASGNWIKETDYNADGSIDATLILEYDASGNCIKKVYYNADGTIRYRFI